jgi:spore photoproduct lyase
MIYIDKKINESKIFRNINKKGIPFEFVHCVSEIEDSVKNIFITNSKSRIVHPCPGTRVYRCCNYYVADIVENCPFSCTYCILQVYLKHNYIKVYDNIDDIIYELQLLDKKGKYRVGSGELSDSLALDKILDLSLLLVPEINKLNNIVFEFKTKSNYISNLLNCSPKNIIVSWSLNPQHIVVSEEFGTASLDARLEAANECAQAGFKLAFHFDPIIFCRNFENVYKELINKLIEKIDENVIKYISLSTFRFMPDLVDYIRENYKDSMLLESHFVKGLDGKMRYFKASRFYMLSYLYKSIRSYWKKVFIYFCMESASMWERIIGFDPGERDNLEKLFIGDKNECIFKF